ncbi:hypothetical protein EJ05DRAFT_2378 [Pseudovirgaria hyperparasitica]|uniref:CST complex subunit Ten1 n=1 Tax=Pseudovirgaria hyperparasitica TaxID=470096 RepID=A0A6A6WI26_9PEZI|nr:uncharacterized protein EJ05DRAFT_2378 [Pseudovirgaria hyperparasitica]KAF2762452.1 hypothetical protein EJ05DRAFT_2378 [Pseudovirgaria hyperparasitica]
MNTTGTGSRLILLPDLDLCRVGDKVRLLGCVEHYDTKTASLVLGYSHQLPHRRRQIRYLANVEISHVLEDVRSFGLQIGTWVNVIGFVKDTSGEKEIPGMDMSSSGLSALQKGVQATMAWEAREVRLDDYERAVRMRTHAT